MLYGFFHFNIAGFTMIWAVSISRLFQTFKSEKDINFPDISVKYILIFQTFFNSIRPAAGEIFWKVNNLLLYNIAEQYLCTIIFYKSVLTQFPDFSRQKNQQQLKFQSFPDFSRLFQKWVKKTIFFQTFQELWTL